MQWSERRRLPAVALAGCALVGVVSVARRDRGRGQPRDRAQRVHALGRRASRVGAPEHGVVEPLDRLEQPRRREPLADVERRRRAEPLPLGGVVQQLGGRDRASAPASPGGTSRPVWPSRMISGRPPWALAITAQPAAAASIAASGERVGRGRGHGDQVRRAVARSRRRRESRASARGLTRRARARARSTLRARSSAPGQASPATRPTAPRSRSGGFASARTSTSWPFQSEILPEDRDHGGVVAEPKRRARGRARSPHRVGREPVGDHPRPDGPSGTARPSRARRRAAPPRVRAAGGTAARPGRTGHRSRARARRAARGRAPRRPRPPSTTEVLECTSASSGGGSAVRARARRAPPAAATAAAPRALAARGGARRAAATTTSTPASRRSAASAPVRREHDQRPVALAVEPGRDQLQLAVGAVAPARGMDEQDARRRALPELDRQRLARRARRRARGGGCGQAARARRRSAARAARSTRRRRPRRPRRRRSRRAGRGASRPRGRRARRQSRRASRSRCRARRAGPPPSCAPRSARPAKPRTSSPPAYSISCGVQWPAANGGSSHSSAATRGSARRAAHRQPDAVDPRRGVADQLDGGVPAVGRLRERPRVAQHLADRVWVERDHPRVRLDLLGDRADVVVGDRAHRAQRLGDDQVGSQVVEGLDVELVDRLAGERALLDGGVDLRPSSARRAGHRG